MSDYSVKDHIAYKMGFKAGQESQAATIAGLQAAVMQCRSLTELLKPQADHIAELEAALATARRDAMEEAAVLLEQIAVKEMNGEYQSRVPRCVVTLSDGISKIRAALEGKKDE